MKKYTFTDLEGNSLVTDDPMKTVSEMWSKFWPVPPIGTMSKVISSMNMGDEILMEDVGVIIRENYRIV